MNWPRVFAYIAAIFLVSGGAFGFVQGWEWLDDRHNQEGEVQLVGGDVKQLQSRWLVADYLQTQKQVFQLEDRWGRDCRKANQDTREWCSNLKVRLEDLRIQIKRLKQ